MFDKCLASKDTDTEDVLEALEELDKDLDIEKIIGKSKNHKVALVLSIIPSLFGFMGLGHIYAGRHFKGIIILVASISIVLVFSFVLIMDAVTFSDEMSDSVRTLTLSMFWGLISGYIALFIWQVYDLKTTLDHI